MIAAGPVVTVTKAGAFFAQAFSSSGGNHQEEYRPKAILCRFPRLRQFPQASPSAVFFLFWFFFLSL
jgi:hypothetical protein